MVQNYTHWDSNQVVPSYEGVDPNLSQKVNLRISCRNLTDLDVFSKSDPCVMVEELFAGNRTTKLGQTETVKNNLNPDFTKAVMTDYFFEVEQRLRFIVADQDGGDVEYIGNCICTMGDIMGSRN